MTGQSAPTRGGTSAPSDGAHTESSTTSADGADSVSDSESSDSLFDGDGDDENAYILAPAGGAAVPRVPGLYILRNLISPSWEEFLLRKIASHGYLKPGEGRNQAMLFGRAGAKTDDGPVTTGLPAWADELVWRLAEVLDQESIVNDTSGLWDLLFRREADLSCSTRDMCTRQCKKRRIEEAIPSAARNPCTDSSRPTSRQLIINHYTPPEGIFAHIDLPSRFGDGIILLSLRSGIGMDFEKQAGGSAERYHLYLPPLSCVLLSGEARWEWTHGIRKSQGDWVRVDTLAEDDDDDDDWVMTQYTKQRRCTDKACSDRCVEYYVPRQQRTSVTIRWLLPGADVVGREHHH